VKYILNREKTSSLISFIFECEKLNNRDLFYVLTESLNKNYIYDYLLQEYGLVIKNGYLIEADAQEMNKGILGRIWGYISNTVSAIGSGFKSIFTAIWSIIKAIWPLLLAGGIGYMTMGGAKLLGLAQNAKGIVDAFKRYALVTSEEGDTRKAEDKLSGARGVGTMISSFVRSVFSFVYDMTRKFFNDKIRKINPEQEEYKTKYEKFEKIAGGVCTSLISFSNSIKSIIDKLNKFIPDFVKSGYDFLKGTVSNFINSITSLFQSEKSENLVNKIKESLNKFLNKTEEETKENQIESVPTKVDVPSPVKSQD